MLTATTIRQTKNFITKGSAFLLALAIAMTLVSPSAGAATTKARYVSYGDDALQAISILPSARVNSPLVILVHGGGWSTGDKTWVTDQARELQAQHFTVFNVNYRLTTSTMSAFPMEIDDIKNATQWAIDHAAQYNASPNKVVLLGGSAGGHLVAAAAQQLSTTNPGVVKKVIMLSAPTDFVSLVNQADAGTLKPSFAANVYQALGCTTGTCSPTEELAWSPASTLSTYCPKWFLMQSTNEFIPADQITSMETNLKNNGCQVTTKMIPGTAHSYAYWPSVNTAIFAFIKQ